MLHPDYIVGLVDGEGSFTVYVKSPGMEKEVKRRVRAEPKFYLKLIEKDKEILYKLKQSFGCGNVYFQKDTRENHQDCYRYEVANRSDLQSIIIPFFKKHPLKLQSKKKDFQIFCRLMKRIQKGEHLTTSGLERLYRLKQKMH
ncbi:MAG: LAGLIDADG family homing endonuclease [bacterium]|nr:LAGLIDADG family homing endonuclease [bacterium]